jgi:hypothetical protein
MICRRDSKEKPKIPISYCFTGGVVSLTLLMQPDCLRDPQ